MKYESPHPFFRALKFAVPAAIFFWVALYLTQCAGDADAAMRQCLVNHSGDVCVSVLR